MAKTPFKSPITDWFNSELRAWVCDMLGNFSLVYSSLGINTSCVNKLKSKPTWSDEETKIIYFLLTLGYYMSNQIILKGVVK